MLFPGSRVWYEGSAADLAALTEEIKSTGFTGHIVLEFQDSLDLVICLDGEFLRVIEKIGRRLLSTKKYREIWGKCQIKAGRMIAFEITPPLARRLRSMAGRRLLCSGTAASGVSTEEILGVRRRERFSGFLDCVSPAGKMLLVFEDGAIVQCHYSEFEGIYADGIAGFRRWHEGFAGASEPSYFFLSEQEADAAPAQSWDDLLMDCAEQVALPLKSSAQRLFSAFGRDAAPGDPVPDGGAAAGTAVFVLEGELGVSRAGHGVSAIIRGGEFLGLGGLCGLGGKPASARALVPTRYLALATEDLPLLFLNSPPSGAVFLRQACALLLGLRQRLEAYRREPRLRDMEEAVARALERQPAAAAAGLTPPALLRELTQDLPLTLPEIDALFRELAARGRLDQGSGRILLRHHDL